MASCCAVCITDFWCEKLDERPTCLMKHFSKIEVFIFHTQLTYIFDQDGHQIKQINRGNWKFFLST